MQSKIFLFMFVLINLLLGNAIAQNRQSTRTAQEILMSHKWYPDIYDEDDGETSFFVYTKTQEIDSTMTEEGDLKVYVATYYLSDTPDTAFDKAKVGQATTGIYIILNRSNNPAVVNTFIYKLIEVSDDKLVIQHLTPGMSAYGHINTCYSTPLKKDK